MTTYVAFLRAINLGANRKFPKADIAAATEAAGFDDVDTHINTGNVRLTTRMRSRAKIEGALEKAYAERAGFEVPTIAFTAAELASIAEDADELAEGRKLERHYVYLLKSAPTAAKAKALQERDGAADAVVVRDRAAHLLLETYQQGVVDPWGVEKALGVAATNRNITVIRTLVQKWCS
ncbi:DUF1697 domain-containing protein [Nocardioides panacisoli]|uniref:DUF1697 domain-containing protein n=1 Tax=Nocardioides panacisoli TaxID=627624 RepID=A0ABP7I6Y2_9ACTN